MRARAREAAADPLTEAYRQARKGWSAFLEACNARDRTHLELVELPPSAPEYRRHELRRRLDTRGEHIADLDHFLGLCERRIAALQPAP